MYIVDVLKPSQFLRSIDHLSEKNFPDFTVLVNIDPKSDSSLYFYKTFESDADFNVNSHPINTTSTVSFCFHHFLVIAMLFVFR